MIHDSYKIVDTTDTKENLKIIHEAFSTDAGKKALQLLADIYIDKTRALFNGNSSTNINLSLHLSYVAGQERVINLIHHLTNSYEELCKTKNN